MAGAGIISGFDMTSEAALAKLSYVLGQPGLSLDGRKEVHAAGLWVWGHECEGSRAWQGFDSGRRWGQPAQRRACVVWKGGRDAGPPRGLGGPLHPLRAPSPDYLFFPSLGEPWSGSG